MLCTGLQWVYGACNGFMGLVVVGNVIKNRTSPYPLQAGSREPCCSTQHSFGPLVGVVKHAVASRSTIPVNVTVVMHLC